MIKRNLNIKLLFLIKVFFICIFLYLKSFTSYAKAADDLIVLGLDSAPVKIKIFSSFSCPHCASFHKKIVPEINRNYVESCKVQLIFIDFPLDQASFNASKLLHCLKRDKQIKFLDMLYENQDKWTNGSNISEINNNLRKLVQTLGINSKHFNNCLNDETISDKILNGRIDGHQKYSINSTPTIIINEKKLNDSASFKNIKKKIEKLI